MFFEDFDDYLKLGTHDFKLQMRCWHFGIFPRPLVVDGLIAMLAGMRNRSRSGTPPSRSGTPPEPERCSAGAGIFRSQLEPELLGYVVWSLIRRSYAFWIRNRRWRRPNNFPESSDAKPPDSEPHLEPVGQFAWSGSRSRNRKALPEPDLGTNLS